MDQLGAQPGVALIKEVSKKLSHRKGKHTDLESAPSSPNPRSPARTPSPRAPPSNARSPRGAAPAAGAPRPTSRMTRYSLQYPPVEYNVRVASGSEGLELNDSDTDAGESEVSFSANLARASSRSNRRTRATPNPPSPTPEDAAEPPSPPSFGVGVTSNTTLPSDSPQEENGADL